MNKKELITKENVKTMGEVIAVACARNRCAMYYTERAKKLYNGLVKDVYHHTGDPAQSFSEGYDLAMEAIAFLCEHIGKRLSDIKHSYRYKTPQKNFTPIAFPTNIFNRFSQFFSNVINIIFIYLLLFIAMCGMIKNRI